MVKSLKVAGLIEGCRGGSMAPHYLGYFECFNRELFYESHEVLEELWLLDKRGRNGDFYKGLIQLAGAFVHLQKQRSAPAASLFRLAKGYLQKYPPIHEQLDVQELVSTIDRWLAELDHSADPLSTRPAPKLSLLQKT